MTARDDWTPLIAALDDDPEGDALRDLTLRAGFDALRRRRVVRRAAMGLVAVLVFVAGFSTRAVLEGASSPTTPGERSAPPVATAEPPEIATPATPESLEIRAELATGAARARLYRLAGDAWLARGETVSATRCYREHLALTKEPRAHEPEDTWLLVALHQTLD